MAPAQVTPHLSGAEQSNNSVVFGERLIMKLFRRVEAGINPDLEMQRFLTERGFPNIPTVAGALLYRRGRDQTSALAMLQAYVPNQGDGWSHALDMLANGDRGAIERYQPLAALLGEDPHRRQRHDRQDQEKGDQAEDVVHRRLLAYENRQHVAEEGDDEHYDRRDHPADRRDRPRAC